MKYFLIDILLSDCVAFDEESRHVIKAETQEEALRMFAANYELSKVDEANLIAAPFAFRYDYKELEFSITHIREVFSLDDVVLGRYITRQPECGRVINEIMSYLGEI